MLYVALRRWLLLLCWLFYCYARRISAEDWTSGCVIPILLLWFLQLDGCMPSEAGSFNWLQFVTVSFPSSIKRFFNTLQYVCGLLLSVNTLTISTTEKKYFSFSSSHTTRTFALSKSCICVSIPIFLLVLSLMHPLVLCRWSFSEVPIRFQSDSNEVPMEIRGKWGASGYWILAIEYWTLASNL